VKRLKGDATVTVVWARLNASSRTKGTISQRLEPGDRREEKRKLILIKTNMMTYIDMLCTWI